MKVQGDILHAIGDRNAVFLVMLDLSAAFDTVDHDRLFHRLSSRLNITDTGFEWVRSYSSDRKNRVCIIGKSSATTKMIFSMPPWWFVGCLPTTSFLVVILVISSSTVGCPTTFMQMIHGYTQPSTQRYLAMRRFASSRSELAIGKSSDG